MKILYKLLLSIILLIVPNVYAASLGKISITGNDNVLLGDTITLDIIVSDLKSACSGVGANIIYDSNYLEYVSSKSGNAPFDINFYSNNNIYSIGGIDLTSNNSFINDTIIYKFVFKAKKEGETSVSLDDLQLYDEYGDDLNPIGLNKTITIESPKIERQVIEEEKNTNEQEINKSDNNIVDNKEIIKETIKESNNISLIKIKDYDLNFYPNILNYSLKVSNNINKLDISITLEDNTATFDISGNDNFHIGNNIVKIMVKTKSLNVKTYTIDVFKEDNKNYLKSIIPSVGELSPSFDKNINDYVISLPNEIDEISFNTILENNNDKLVIDGPERLVVGNNNYKLKVNNNIYNIIVNRKEEEKQDSSKYISNNTINNNYVLYTILLIIIIVMEILIIILIRRINKNRVTK